MKHCSMTWHQLAKISGYSAIISVCHKPPVNDLEGFIQKYDYFLRRVNSGETFPIQ